MPDTRRVSRLAVLLLVCVALMAGSALGSVLQTAGSATPTLAPQSASGEPPAEPRALYRALNELRPDGAQVYEVQNLNLRRDVVSLTLTEGKLAFLQPLGGRVTGAVFTGRGHVIATPPDPGERRSLAQFLGVPILDQTFSSAYFRFDDETATEIERQIRNAGVQAASDLAFVQGWGAVLADLNPWHSLRIMADWLSAAPLPYFYARLAGDSAGLFDVLVDARRNEEVLFGQTRTANGAPFYDVWASFRASRSPSKPLDAPLDSFVPLDYRVDTTIEDDLSLEGTTTLHLKTLRAGERVLSLELSRSLSVEEIEAEDGRPLVYFQNQELSRHDILRRGNDAVLVVLPAPARAGEEFRLHVSYRGSVISDAGNGVEFVGERGTWYARAGSTDYFVPFVLSFGWPKRFTLVATGTEVEAKEDGNAKIGRWRSEVPFAVAGFNLGQYTMETAGAGDPKIRLYANRELEDAILSRLQRSSPPPTLQVPNLPRRFGLGRIEPQMTLPSPPPPPSPAAVLNQLGSQVLDSIRFFEKMNGRFPLDHIDISQIPGTFGQGWPGLVYLSTLAFLPREAQGRAGINEEQQKSARELMPFHEVAHQWWGNVVGSAGYRDAWIEEGMANYLALLYGESKKPGEHRMANWLERYRAELIAKAPGTNETLDQAGPLNLGYRLASSKTPEAYNTVIYGKGTWVMHMLHEMMRDPAAKDPDARFRDLLRSILTQYRFRTLSTDGFERAVEERMTPSMDLEGDRSMDWFFDQWVRGTGIPRYSVEFQVKPHGQEFVVTGSLEQTGVDDLFTAPVPLYAARARGKPERLGIVVTTGPETRFHFIARVRPAQLLIDPQLTLLCRLK